MYRLFKRLNAIIFNVFYILDQGYNECKNDDLGGFLGAISPEIWEDGQPIDQAVFKDWEKMNHDKAINMDNIARKYYQ